MRLKRPDMADAVRAFLRHYVDRSDFVVTAVSARRLTMAFSHRFDPTTLREYDIRGIVGAHSVGGGCVRDRPLFRLDRRAQRWRTRRGRL